MGGKPQPRFVLDKQSKWRPKKKVFTKDGRLFFFPNSSKDQLKKKGLYQNGRLFSPNSREDQRSDADQSQIIGGMQMQAILKLLGGGYS